MATTFSNEPLHRAGPGGGWAVAAYLGTLLTALVSFIAVCLQAVSLPIPRPF